MEPKRPRRSPLDVVKGVGVLPLFAGVPTSEPVSALKKAILLAQLCPQSQHRGGKLLVRKLEFFGDFAVTHDNPAQLVNSPRVVGPRRFGGVWSIENGRFQRHELWQFFRSEHPSVNAARRSMLARLIF